MNISSLVGHILQLYEQIDGQNKPADRLVGEFFKQKKYLGSHDRRFISDVVYGMTRHLKFIKTLVREFIAQNPGTQELGDPHLRYLAYYIAYIVAVEKSASIPSFFWKTYFPKIEIETFTQWINLHADLDFLNEDAVSRLGTKYSFPNWMVTDWQTQIGDDTEMLLQTLNSASAVSLRANLLKTTREECRKRLQTEGIETEISKLSSAGLIARKRFHNMSLGSFKDGWFELQDEGSQLISEIAAPRPGSVVIDVCAGAGGKSLHLAQLMNDQGKIISIDVDKFRLAELNKRAVRAGVSIIQTKLNSEIDTKEYFDIADIVLVDAPCSGVGTIRRSPWLKWGITESLVEHHAEKQKSILAFSSQLVKPGGKLVYATCSLFRAENEVVVNSFLNSSKGFKIVSAGKSFLNSGLTSNKSMITMYPHRSGTDGFFVAVMERIE